MKLNRKADIAHIIKIHVVSFIQSWQVLMKCFILDYVSSDFTENSFSNSFGLPTGGAWADPASFSVMGVNILNTAFTFLLFRF